MNHEQVYGSYIRCIKSADPFVRWSEGYKNLMILLASVSVPEELSVYYKDFGEFMDSFKRLEDICRDIEILSRLDEGSRITVSRVDKGFVPGSIWTPQEFRDWVETSFRADLVLLTVGDVKARLWDEFIKVEPSGVVRLNVEKYLIDKCPEVLGGESI